MSSEQFPADALFIRWGRFHAGASGRVAMIAAVAAAVVALAICSFGRM
jgi:hypothetical protein